MNQERQEEEKRNDDRKSLPKRRQDEEFDERERDHGQNTKRQRVPLVGFSVPFFRQDRVDLPRQDEIADEDPVEVEKRDKAVPDHPGGRGTGVVRL